MEPDSTQNLFGLIFLFVFGHIVWDSIPPKEVRKHGKQASRGERDARP